MLCLFAPPAPDSAFESCARGPPAAREVPAAADAVACAARVAVAPADARGCSSSSGSRCSRTLPPLPTLMTPTAAATTSAPPWAGGHRRGRAAAARRMCASSTTSRPCSRRASRASTTRPASRRQRRASRACRRAWRAGDGGHQPGGRRGRERRFPTRGRATCGRAYHTVTGRRRAPHRARRHTRPLPTSTTCARVRVVVSLDGLGSTAAASAAAPAACRWLRARQLPHTTASRAAVRRQVQPESNQERCFGPREQVQAERGAAACKPCPLSSSHATVSRRTRSRRARASPASSAAESASPPLSGRISCRRCPMPAGSARARAAPARAPSTGTVATRASASRCAASRSRTLSAPARCDARPATTTSATTASRATTRRRRLLRGRACAQVPATTRGFIFVIIALVLCFVVVGLCFLIAMKRRRST